MHQGFNKIFQLIRISCLISVLLPIAACVTLKRADGEAWTRPVELGLSEDSLAGFNIALDCGIRSKASSNWAASDLEECHYIVDLLKDLGARVYYPANNLESPVVESEDGNLEKPPISFRLIYLRAETKSDICAYPLLLLSMGLYPCIINEIAKAELLLLDEFQLIQDQKIFFIEAKKVYGVVALWYQAVRALDGGKRKSEESELQLHWAHYVQNSVYTFAQRHNHKKLAKDKKLISAAGGKP